MMMPLSQSPSATAGISSLDNKNELILKSVSIQKNPSSNLNYLQDNGKKGKHISLPDGVEGNGSVLSKHKKRKPSVERQKANAKKKAIKKPRSLYNLFFQVERELILSDLSCPPEAKFLATHQSCQSESKFISKKSMLLLDNAIPNVPCPARYRGSNILNPIYKVKTEKRKHHRAHGKISFIQLGKKVAQNWKCAGEDVKDYFRELSFKDHERYFCELGRSEYQYAAMAMLTTDGRIPCVKPSTAYESQMEIKRCTDTTNSPTADKKIKLIHGDPHTDIQMEAHLKQHSCDP
eukprot:1648752-Ditylum_brightwellii.AAC.1